MPVVSNTSPIWDLASLERLGLLHDQFPDVRIPQDVLNELQIGYEYPEKEESDYARIQTDKEIPIMFPIVPFYFCP